MLDMDFREFHTSTPFMNKGKKEKRKDRGLYNAPVRCAPRAPAMVWLEGCGVPPLPARSRSSQKPPRGGGDGRYESPILDPPETLEQ